MNENIRNALQDKIIRISTVISVLLICVQSVLIFIYNSQFPPLTPFFNSFPWGVQRLVPSSYVLTIPPIVIGIFILNNSISFLIYKRFTLLSRILTFNALLFITLGFLAYIQILFLVF